MKRSPYFFQRLQAGKRLQTYLSASFALFLITMGVGVYSWQTPEDSTLRMAILTRSKPALVSTAAPEAIEVAAEAIELPSMLEAVEPAAPEEFQLESIETAEVEASQLIPVLEQPLIAEKLQLPESYNRFEPEVALNDISNITAVSFATEVTDEYEALSPRQLFAEGFYTLYGAFDYEGMADGMVWSWVWRLDGEVVQGGNEVWAYGEAGPGYIYYEPRDGFKAGQYALDIWVNGELMSRSTAIMNSTSISANN